MPLEDQPITDDAGLQAHGAGRSYKQDLLVFLFAALATLMLSSGVYVGGSVYQRIDALVYDRFLAVFPAPQGSGNVVTVDIDEISIDRVGQWPWPRYRLARLIQMIHRMAPQVVALDIFLPEPDRTSLENIKQQFKTDFRLDLEFSGAPPSLADNDAYLAYVLGETGTVGARYLYFDHVTPSAPCKEFPVHIRDDGHLLNLNQASGMLCNLVVLEQGLASSGFTNSQYDKDGILRRLPLLIQYQERIYPHLCLAVYLKAMNIQEAVVNQDVLGPYIQAGPSRIPVAANGDSLIGFAGPAGMHPSISAVDILNQACPPSKIRDKIVLIGSSAVGLNDIHHTPFDAHYPGIEVQATFLENIFNGHIHRTPPWTPHLVFAVCMASGLALSGLFVRSSSPVKLVMGTTALMLVILCTSLVLFGKYLVYIPPGLPVLTAGFLFSLLSFGRFVLARRASAVWFKKLARSQQLTLEAMVSMVETRDPETGAHIKRTQNYAKITAMHLQAKGFFTETLTPGYINMLFLSVPLHDIGKVGIPDRILLKQGPLTDEEFELMKLHTVMGQEAIDRATGRIHGDNYLKMGAEIAGSHHEKWNGQGYPKGIAGNDIPLSGRIMAVCDVYDALTSKRCYKPPFTHEKSMGIILEQKGTAFDPRIVDAFFDIEEQVKAVARQYKDPIETAPEKLQEIYMGDA